MKIRDVVYYVEPYTVGYEEDKVYLASNENPHNIPDEIKIRLFEKLKCLEFNRYPSPMADGVREKLSSMLGIDQESIIVGSGSDELLFYITLVTSACGGVVVAPVPSFSMYKYYAVITGAKFVEIPLKRDFSLPVDNVIGTVNSLEANLVFLGYPNNPTGNLWSKEDILRIVERVDCVVVVDEAYYEFSGSTLLPYVSKYPNLVVSRTFSKAWALAGLRAGYLIARNRVVDALKRIKQPFNVNVLTQKIVEFCIEHREYMLEFVENIIKERKRVEEELSEIKGVSVFPTCTNFVVFSGNGVSARRIYEEGIFVKEFDFANSRYIRATVGRREENDLLISIVRRIAEG